MIRMIKYTTFLRLLLSLSISILIVGLVPATAADLTVNVQNVEKAQGKVMIALFSADQAAIFPNKGAPMGGIQIQVQSTQVSGVFKDLKPGKYALAVYHDENDNGKNDTNLIGIPKEPFGFSNDAQANFGPPKFADAAITVGNAPTTITINLMSLF